MTFNKCSVNGKIYGDLMEEGSGDPANVDEVTAASIKYAF